MATPAFELEPMSIGDILDRTVRLYRRGFLHNLGIVAVPYILLIPLGAVAASAVWFKGDPRALLNPGVIGAGILVVLAFVWLNFMSMGALARSVSERFLGRMPSVWASYRAVFQRTFSLLWAFFLAFLAWGGVGIVGALLIAGAAMAGPIPAVLIAIVVGIAAVLVFFRFLLVTQVIVIENVRGSAALQRSWTLMRKNFWRALLVLVFSVAVALLLTVALNVPGSVLARMVPTPGGTVLEHVLSQLAQILIMPFWSIAFTLLYYDSRIRKEAFDLEMMAQNLGAPEAPAAPAPPTVLLAPRPHSSARAEAMATADTVLMADPLATLSPAAEVPKPSAMEETLVMPPPAAPPPAQTRPESPRRPVGAFKVCPKCAAQVPFARAACSKCGTPVPFRSAG